MPNDLILNPKFNPALGATPTNQQYVFANPNTAIINPTTGQTASSAMGAITSESLKQETPIKIENPIPLTVPDTGGTTETMKSNTASLATPVISSTDTSSSWLADLLKSNDIGTANADLFQSTYGMTPEEARTQRETAQTNLNTQNEAVQKAQQEYDALNAQITGLDYQQNTVIPEKINQEMEGRGVTAGGIAPLIASEQRAILLKKAPLQYQALLAQSNLANAQGKATLAQGILTQAKSHIDSLFSAQQQDITNKVNTQNKNFEAIYDYLSKKEQNQVADMKTQTASNTTQTNNFITDLQSVIKTATENGDITTAGLLAKLATTPLDPTSTTFAQDYAKANANLASLQAQIKIEDPAVKNLRETYHDAGILPTDDIATAQDKIKNSRIYQKEVRVAQDTVSGGGGTGITGDVSAISPTAQAVLNGTIRLEDLTATEKGKIAGELNASGYKSQPKLSSGQQEDLSTMDTVNKSIDQILAYNSDGTLEGIGSFGLGTLKGWAAQLGFGSEEGKSVRALIGNVKGTIAKLRGGTSFTPNEEKLLETYTPSINDNPAVAINKMNLLKQFIENKKSSLYQFAQDRTLPQSNLEGEALRSKYNY